MSYYRVTIDEYIRELAQQECIHLAHKQMMYELRMNITREAGPNEESRKEFDTLVEAYECVMKAKTILNATNLQEEVALKYARVVVDQWKIDALNEVMPQLVEYQPSTPHVEQGIRMNSEDMAQTKTILYMRQKEITTIEARPWLKAYHNALANFVFLYEEYQSSYPDYFFRETTKRIYLEEQYKQAREEEREIISRIQQLQTELKQLAHESVQGNLSALPAEYRIARKQGKSVAEAMAIAKAAKEAAKAAKSIQPLTP
jgi:hypothetical protein